MRIRIGQTNKNVDRDIQNFEVFWIARSISKKLSKYLFEEFWNMQVIITKRLGTFMQQNFLHIFLLLETAFSKKIWKCKKG